MFLPKFPMPVLTGFATTTRYILAVGFTNPVSTPLLKAQTTRLTGSSGSGTDSGRTTLSSFALFEIVAPSTAMEGADCPAARATKQHARPIAGRIRRESFTASLVGHEPELFAVVRVTHERLFVEEEIWLRANRAIPAPRRQR